MNDSYRKIGSFVSIACFLMLGGCAHPTPLPTSSMLPSDTVYNQTSKNFYLKHKIFVSDFNYDGPNREAGATVFANFHDAVYEALEKGGYIAAPGQAIYRLNGTIKEIRVPRCLFGSCNSGSAIEYVVTNIKTQHVAFQQLVVVPYTMECPVFMGDSAPQYIAKAYTETVGANIAQLIQILNRKTASDLK